MNFLSTMTLTNPPSRSCDGRWSLPWCSVHIHQTASRIITLFFNHFPKLGDQNDSTAVLNENNIADNFKMTAKQRRVNCVGVGQHQIVIISVWKHPRMYPEEINMCATSLWFWSSVVAGRKHCVSPSPSAGPSGLREHYRNSFVLSRRNEQK